MHPKKRQFKNHRTGSLVVGGVVIPAFPAAYYWGGGNYGTESHETTTQESAEHQGSNGADAGVTSGDGSAAGTAAGMGALS